MDAIGNALSVIVGSIKFMFFFFFKFIVNPNLIFVQLFLFQFSDDPKTYGDG